VGRLSMQSLLKENITGYVVLPYNKKENCYAILITDNSMAQKIEQGDIVLADMDEKVANDSIVIAVLKDGRQIVRRYREVAQNIVLLLADNNDYPVLTINKSDIEVIHAIVGTWKTFRKG
jgi:SOS-response transcriptional repressor LexA